MFSPVLALSTHLFIYTWKWELILTLTSQRKFIIFFQGILCIPPECTILTFNNRLTTSTLAVARNHRSTELYPIVSGWETVPLTRINPIKWHIAHLPDRRRPCRASWTLHSTILSQLWRREAKAHPITMEVERELNLLFREEDDARLANKASWRRGHVHFVVVPTQCGRTRIPWNNGPSVWVGIILFLLCWGGHPMFVVESIRS